MCKCLERGPNSNLLCCFVQSAAIFKSLVQLWHIFLADEIFAHLPKLTFRTSFCGATRLRTVAGLYVMVFADFTLLKISLDKIKNVKKKTPKTSSSAYKHYRGKNTFSSFTVASNSLLGCAFSPFFFIFYARTWNVAKLFIFLSFFHPKTKNVFRGHFCLASMINKYEKKCLLHN